MPIIQRAAQIAGVEYGDATLTDHALRIIADHGRGVTFLVADGVRPGTQGRDYVCRMVLRRAMRFGKKLPFDTPTMLAGLSQVVVNTMSAAYPDLRDQRDTIYRTIALEEQRFLRTMDRGLDELNVMLDELAGGQQLSGEQAFYLHATLGLPLEVTRDIAEERGFGVDMAGFKAQQEKHIAASKQGSLFGEIDIETIYGDLMAKLEAEGFRGTIQRIYPENAVNGESSLQTSIIALLQNGHPIETATVGERVEVVLAETPFYVESGGQISDTGIIEGNGWVIDIEDVRKPVGGLIIHIGEVVEGIATHSPTVQASVDAKRRLAIMRNHTATHLLHAALRNRLGGHVQQRGSLVAPDRLRFDFSHDQALSRDELYDVERDVNHSIIEGLPVMARLKALDEARAEGAMALFGEKYGDIVRTITIGEGPDRYSYELCGGTHLDNTAIIGSFVVVQETSVAQGIRRIEAVTGEHAYMISSLGLRTLQSVAQQLQTIPVNLPDRVAGLQAQLKHHEREIQALRAQLAHFEFDNLLKTSIEAINGAQVLVAQVGTTDADTLRKMADWFRDAVAEHGVLVVGMISEDGKPQLLSTVTKDLTDKVHAGNLIRDIAQIVGGGGGGRPNMAQAGGKDATKLAEALDRAKMLIGEALS